MNRLKRMVTCTIWLPIFLALLCFSIFLLGNFQARAAEDVAASPRALFEYHLETLATLPAGSEKDLEVREKIIRLFHQLDPPPAIPEEARRHAIRAQTFVETATNEEEYGPALTEFDKALRLAPWWPDAYFNYALVQEAAGDAEGALQSYTLFLLAAPNDPDARKIQNKIYELEIKAEKQAIIKRWAGTWKFGTNIFESKIRENIVSMVLIEPSSSSSKMGYRAGDRFCYGTVQGSKMTGKFITIATNNNEIRCFGQRPEHEATGTISPDGKTFTVIYKKSNYQFQSCRINYYFDSDPFEFTRIEE